MGKKRQLKLSTAKNLIDNKSFKNQSIITKSKLLYKVANVYQKTNNLKYMNIALKHYNDIYRMFGLQLGFDHHRVLNVLIKINLLEKRIEARKISLKNENKKE